MQQPEVDNPKIAVLGNSEGTVLAPRVAIDTPDKVNNIVLMGTLAQNVTDILHFQTITLPLLYAKEVLDKNGNGSLSLQEASQDVVFERLIEGNLSVILTCSLPNGTSLLHPEYNRNNDTLINLERELIPVLEQNAKLFFTSSKTGSAEGKCTILEGCVAYEKSFFAYTNLFINLYSMRKIFIVVVLIVYIGLAFACLNMPQIATAQMELPTNTNITSLNETVTNNTVPDATNEATRMDENAKP